MDKLRATFGKKKTKGNLLSDPSVSPPRTPAHENSLPSFSSLLGTPSPQPPIPSTSPPHATTAKRNTTYYEPAAYSVVGGDGAIGGLEWTEEEATFTSAQQPATIQEHPENVLVPTLGQVDQLTEHQEGILSSMRPPVESRMLGDDNDEEDFWSQPLTRTRSNGEDLSRPADLQTIVPAGQPVIASAPAPVVATPTPIPAPAASTTPVPTSTMFGGFAGSTGPSAAAMVAGSRSTSGVGASVLHSAVVAPVQPPTPNPILPTTVSTAAATGSAPGSRRGSLSEQRALSTPGTPVQPTAVAATVLPLVSVSASPDPSSSLQSSPAPPKSASSQAATATPSQRPGAFAYPMPTTRPSVAGPHSSMMRIGRVAAEEVKALVGPERLTSSEANAQAPHARVTSPGYLAYVTAIQEAKAEAQGQPVSTTSKDRKTSTSNVSSSTSNNLAMPLPTPPMRIPAAPGSGASSTTASASNSNPSAGLGESPNKPALPPRTHARHRYSTTRYGSRRGSTVDMGGSMSLTKEQREMALAQEQLSQEQLIPLNPLVHLVMTTFLLTYFALHLFLPGIVALSLPLIAFYLFRRMGQTIDTYLQAHYPKVAATFTMPTPEPPPLTSPIKSVLDVSILDEVDNFRRARSIQRSNEWKVTDGNTETEKPATTTDAAPNE